MVEAPVPVGSSADARGVQAQVGGHIVVRSALGGEREWQVPDVHGDLSALALKQHLVAHGGVSRLDQPVLLAGTRPLKSTETVQTVLAESGAGHVTLVRCDRSWLADERVILSAKYLKAVLDGVLSPTSSSFDATWTAAGAPEVGPEELEELVHRALCEEDLVRTQEPSVGDFLILLGTLLQSFLKWYGFNLPRMHKEDRDSWDIPRVVARCGMHWALAFATAGDVHDASWPVVLPFCNKHGSVLGVIFYRPPGCDVLARFGEDLARALNRNGVPDAMELEGVDRARFTAGLRWVAPGGPALTARAALAALRVRTRVAAGLPVVLLGDFPGREDAEICELARHLLPCQQQMPGLSEHEVAELPGDFRLLPPETRAPLEELPLTLLRARGDAEETRRLVQLAAAAGGWSPRMVWSVSTCGRTLEQVLSMLPWEFGGAAAISL